MANSTLPKGIKGFGASVIDDELHIFIKRDVKGLVMNSSAEFDAQVQKALIDCVAHINNVGLCLKEDNGSKTT